MEKKIVAQIRRLCEKQYRKGFQHGYIACDEDLLIPHQVTMFRASGADQGYRQVRNPISNLPYPKSYPDLLASECGMDDMEELCRLLEKYKYEFNEPILWKQEGNIFSDPCPFCNEPHFHVGEEGYYVANCEDETTEEVKEYLLQEYRDLTKL